jgi:hypothetical protein
MAAWLLTALPLSRSFFVKNQRERLQGRRFVVS